MPFSEQTPARPTWAEIDLDALAENLRVIRAHVGPEVKVMAAVKGDAYGHGALECARRLESEGVDWFGVALPEEGAELRGAGITRPVLCLGGFSICGGSTSREKPYRVPPGLIIFPHDRGWTNVAAEFAA